MLSSHSSVRLNVIPSHFTGKETDIKVKQFAQIALSK